MTKAFWSILKTFMEAVEVHSICNNANKTKIVAMVLVCKISIWVWAQMQKQ